MGFSIDGHLAVGLGFFIIGLWHLYNNLKLLALKGSSNFKIFPWFPSKLMRHLELYFIITGGTLYLTEQLFKGLVKHPVFDSNGTISSTHLRHFEHSNITLTFIAYAIFAIVCDICSYKNKLITSLAMLDVEHFIVGLAFSQQLLLLHLHSTDHMGVEGQYHWLLQLIIAVSLITTLAGIGHGGSSFIIAMVRSLSIVFQGLWLIVIGFAFSITPGLIGKGCFINHEPGHMVIRCDGQESLNRAKALVNIQFSSLLILLAIFTGSFYLFMMHVYVGNNSEIMYSTMSLNDEEDLEAQKICSGLA